MVFNWDFLPLKKIHFIEFKSLPAASRFELGRDGRALILCFKAYTLHPSFLNHTILGSDRLLKIGYRLGDSFAMRQLRYKVSNFSPVLVVLVINCCCFQRLPPPWWIFYLLSSRNFSHM